MNWVKEKSQSFLGIKNRSYRSDNFNFLKPTIADSKVVALGESTHGTSEFFKLKHHIFRYFVEELGFRVFALEDNQLACEKVNDYVQGRLDTSTEESMSELFAVWYTNEMKALIKWIKHYNLSNQENQIQFVGFDIQDYELPFKSVTTFLKEKDSSLLAEISGFEAFAENTHIKSDSLKKHWFNKMNSVYKEIQNLSNETGLYKLDLQHINLLKQFTENALKGHWSLYRDKAMAENIIWLAETRFPNHKIFIWAHDVHVSKSNHPNEMHNLNNGIAMGHFLSKHLKEDYMAYGLMTFSGDYLALKSYYDYERIFAPLYPAPKGSLEEALHQIAVETGARNLFLNFYDSKNWLKSPLPLRFANHVNIDHGFWQQISLPYQFDGVFFIDHTNPSDYLNK